MSDEDRSDTILPPPTINGHRVDPESGMYLAPDRTVDGRGRPRRWGDVRPVGRPVDPPRRPSAAQDAPQSKVARVEPAPPPERRTGSTKGPVGLGALARVLRPHGRLPTPPVDPQRRHARHGRAAHRHRAARARHDAQPRRDAVRQARRRDPQAHQAGPAGSRHARGDRHHAAADRARLRSVPRPRPDAGGDPRGLRDAPGGRHRRRVPGGESGADADAAEEPAA